MTLLRRWIGVCGYKISRFLISMILSCLCLRVRHWKRCGYAVIAIMMWRVTSLIILEKPSLISEVVLNFCMTSLVVDRERVKALFSFPILYHEH